MKKQLPEYFAIKWSDNPLWRDYIKWLNEKDNINEYNIKVGDIITIISDFTVTKVTETEIFLGSESSGYSFKRVNNNLKNNFWKLKKQDDMKEIIGYKVKDKKYLPFANKLHDYSANQPFNFIYKIHTSEFSIKNFKAAGVLDIWFEPVYKEEKTLPKINGYDGVLEKSYVVYGCAKFNIKYIEELHGLINRNKVLLGNKDIASITLDSGVEITIEQIKEIYEYIKSKN